MFQRLCPMSRKRVPGLKLIGWFLVVHKNLVPPLNSWQRINSESKLLTNLIFHVVRVLHHSKLYSSVVLGTCQPSKFHLQLMDVGDGFRIQVLDRLLLRRLSQIAKMATPKSLLNVGMDVLTVKNPIQSRSHRKTGLFEDSQPNVKVITITLDGFTCLLMVLFGDKIDQTLESLEFGLDKRQHISVSGLNRDPRICKKNLPHAHLGRFFFGFGALTLSFPPLPPPRGGLALILHNFRLIGRKVRLTENRVIADSFTLTAVSNAFRFG